MSTRPEAPVKPPRREAELTFLRLVPGNTVVHRLWPGTKLLVATFLALMVSIAPTWPVIGIAAGVVALGMLCARIPLGAFPRLPKWFFLALAFAAWLNLWSGAEPIVHVGGIELSIGGLSEWARFTLVAVVLIASGALIGWTTRLGDVAPAIRSLFRPLRWVRLPVDEWVVAIALAIRCLPLMIDEIRMLNAARRLRRQDLATVSNQERGAMRAVIVETTDLLSTAVVTSMRRARDLGEAMIARGGLGGAIAADVRKPRFVDFFVLTCAIALCVVVLAVLHL